MFPPGEGKDPVNKWVKRVRKFFKTEINKNVQAHNFRKTAATEFYNTSKDIIALQKYMGHSDVKIT